MSARIIIVKNGERWEVKFGVAPTVCTGAGGSFLNVNGSNYKIYKIPPVERTDNSEVIARLEAENETARIAIQSAQARFDEELEALRAENAKLREALKPIMEFRVAPAKWITIKEMYHKAFDAVRDSQDVMKGGAE